MAITLTGRQTSLIAEIQSHLQTTYVTTVVFPSSTRRLKGRSHIRCALLRCAGKRFLYFARATLSAAQSCPWVHLCDPIQPQFTDPSQPNQLQVEKLGPTQ